MTASQWYFGGFRLDPDHACLWRGEQALALTPKVFAVLHYLVTHPDRLVSKEELLDAVWPDVAVTEAVLRVTIGMVRKILDDQAQSPHFIATMPRRGYRFLASVTEAPASAPTTPRHPTILPMPAAGLSEAPTPALNGLVASPHAGVSPVSGALEPLEAERRPLTVLCCTLVDASRLASHVDPEDWRDVMRAYHETCATVIQRFDGYVAQYLDDSVLGYFGYPMAHEDDAQRGVWTGLGLLEALASRFAQLPFPAGEHVAVRLGVHTGLVVIGAVGMDARQEPFALGETFHITKQLQALAAPNTLVISAATYQRITGYFTCEVLGEPLLQELEQPLQAYCVLRPSGIQSRLEVASASGLSPLVGRTAEVEILWERWARVKAGMGQVAVLTGEAGIGKSRLVRVVQDHVAHEAHLCWECRGVSYYQHTALYPLTECLQRWLQWRPGTAPAAALVQLEALLTQAQLVLEEAVPLLADLLALPLPAERYAPLSLLPEQQRQRTLDVLLALLGGLAAQQPVLMIVEDLHWVDPSTLELIERLLNQIPTACIYLLLTYRPEFQPPWGFRTYLTPLALTRLIPAHAAAMVEAMPGAALLPAAVRAQIVAQTDGIPLFVEEVTKAVLEAGQGADSQAPHVAPGLEPGLVIPVTLHEALLARLARLGSTKGVAQLGAVLGRQFTFALLHAVAGCEAEALQRDLATLVTAELLYQRGQPSRATYTFKHALIQEAAYTSMLQRVRRKIHQRVVQVLETQWPETATTTPALLAHHALRGALWSPAVAYSRQAGEQAMTRSAHREAVAAFEQALGALQHLPESRDTLMQAIDLRLALRNALWPLGELGQIFVCLQDAHTHAEVLGDPARLGWVAVYLLAHYVVACDPVHALACGERALTCATDQEDVALLVTAQSYLGNGHRSLGNYRRSVEFFRRNVACLHGTLLYDRFGLHGFVSAMSRGYLAACLAECGTFAEARTVAEEGVRIADAADHPYSRVVAGWGLGFQRLRQGDISQAIPVLEQTCALAHETPIRLLLPLAVAALGAAYTLAERIAEALALLEQVIEHALAMQFLFDHALRVVWLGEAYLRAGRLAEASTQAQRALEFAQAHQERGHEAYALRLLGAIPAQRSPQEGPLAAAYYRQALALAEELGMSPLQAHCQRGLGMLYAATGQAAPARTALSTASTMYQSMDMTFWLPETEAVLGQVPPVASGMKPWSALRGRL